MKTTRNESAERTDELLGDYYALCCLIGFCQQTYGNGRPGCADADALDVFARKHLSVRHVIAYALSYAKGCGKPLDSLEPREVADAMARDGERAFGCYADQCGREAA